MVMKVANSNIMENKSWLQNIPVWKADERQNMPIANVVSICVTGYLGEGRSIRDQEVV